MRQLYRQYRLFIPILMLLILPSLSALWLGYTFQDHVVSHIPFVITDHDDSALSRSLVRYIAENPTFAVKFTEEQEAELEKHLRYGEAAAGIIIPAGFSQDLQKGNSPKVLILYDGTQMSSAGVVKAKVAEILGTVRAGYLSGVMQQSVKAAPQDTGVLIQPVSLETRCLGNPGKSTPLFILGGLLLNIVQLAVYLLGVEIADPAEPLSFKGAVKGSLFAGAVGTVSTAMVLAILVLFFNYPFRGSFLTAAVLTFIYLSGIGAVGIVLRLLMRNQTMAVQMTTLIMAMLLLAGYTFPATAMPPSFQPISWLIPFTHYGSPMRDILLLGHGAPEVRGDLLFSAIFVLAVWLGLWAIIHIKKKITGRQKNLNRKEGNHDQQLLETR